MGLLGVSVCVRVCVCVCVCLYGKRELFHSQEFIFWQNSSWCEQILNSFQPELQLGYGLYDLEFESLQGSFYCAGIPHWLFGPPNLLFKGYWELFMGVKIAGARDWPPYFIAEVKNE
jgi:hypothetical protein